MSVSPLCPEAIARCFSHRIVHFLSDHYVGLVVSDQQYKEGESYDDFIRLTVLRVRIVICIVDLLSIGTGLLSQMTN